MLRFTSLMLAAFVSTAVFAENHAEPIAPTPAPVAPTAAQPVAPQASAGDALVNRRGEVIAFSKNSQDRQREASEALEKFAAEQNVVIEKLSSTDKLRLILKLVREKELSPNALRGIWDKIILVHVLAHSTKAKQMDPAGQMKLVTAETMKEIATKLDLSEKYLKLEVKTADADRMVDGIDQAMQKAAKQMASVLGDALSQSIGQAVKQATTGAPHRRPQ